MKINLRGGGDIASNPERERCRRLTDCAYWGLPDDAHGAGEAIPGPTRALDTEKVSDHGSAPQSSATGQEGALNENVHCNRYELSPEELRKLTQPGNCYVPHPPKDGAHE